jgi:GNAT superfamily N-acetyltransferase
MTVRIRPFRPDADHIEPLATGLTDILLDCVNGGASVSFMAPLARDKARAFWDAVITGASRGDRTLLIAEDQPEHQAPQIQGTVQLLLATPENQPHRADVAKLLVHRRARRTGVGEALMHAVEDAALTAGRTLLVLDTVTGSPAERLYTRLGWHRLGVIPNYALWPTGGFCDTTYFYKTLK